MLDYDEVVSGLMKCAAAGTTGYRSLTVLPLRFLSTPPFFSLLHLLLSFSTLSLSLGHGLRQVM